MIIDKKQKEQPTVIEETVGTEESLYTSNAICDVFNAIKEILSNLTYDPDDPASPKIFNHVALNNGQLRRIRDNKRNTEEAVRFPAAFIHFINVRYLVQQSRVGEGRATMRIQYVLNRLNCNDSEHELEGFKIFQLINVAIQDGKDKYDALNERVNLTYFDQPESFANGLQAYWIDYEIWFRENSAYKYRNYVERYIVAPPFTNHSDQKPELNVDGHEDHGGVAYDEIGRAHV